MASFADSMAICQTTAATATMSGNEKELIRT